MAKTRTLQKKNFMDMFSGKQILIPIVAWCCWRYLI